MHNVKTEKNQIWKYYMKRHGFGYAVLQVAFFIYVCPKMRSAQTPFGIWAIMKKFIYMCNEKHYGLSRLLCD